MGNCCKLPQNQKQTTKKYEKEDPKTALKENKKFENDESCVEVMQLDGNSTMFNHVEEELFEYEDTETLALQAETLDGTQYNLEITPTDTIGSLKNKLKTQLPDEFEDFKLILKGRVLREDRLVKNYRISNQTVIDIMPNYNLAQ